MRNAMLSIAAAASLLVAGAATFAGEAAAGSDNAASIDRDFNCSMPDASRGNVVSGTANNHSVITNSKNNSSVLKCVIKDVPNRSGKAVRFSGFVCNTFLGSTRNSHQVISASGVGVLTCIVRH
mgnify:CR=1 FL=1